MPHIPHGPARLLVPGARLASCTVAVLMTLLALLAAPARAADIAVATPADLNAALEQAGPGDVLSLASGDYGPLRLSARFEGGALTLRSADPGAPARFTALRMEGAAGILLDTLVFDYTFAPGDDAFRTRVSQIIRSRDISMRRVTFDGDRPAAKGGYGVGIGLAMRWAEDVTIEDSTFHGWYRGMVVSQSDGITLRGNDFHSIRSDGVDFAEVNRVLVENSHFHDFDRASDSRDHPDMIQFWTNGTKTPSTDVTIRNNVFNAGHGLWTQTIFIRNEEVDTGRRGRDMFYRDFTISGNVIVNSHLHGITLGEIDGLSITDNTLVHNPRAVGEAQNPSVWTPTIRVKKTAENVHIARNIAPDIVGHDGQSDWEVTGNLRLHNGNPDDPGHTDRVFVAARRGDPATLAPFTYLPGSDAAEGRVGAPRLAPAAMMARSQGGIAPLIRVAGDDRFVNRFTFDAGFSRGADPAAARWSFSDGGTAEGAVATHDFPAPGTYTATLDLDGAQAGAEIEVPGFQVLRLAGGQLVADGARDVSPPADMQTVPLPGGGRGVLMGAGVKPVAIARGAVSGFFGARDFTLDMRLRAAPTGTPAGEILRIHNNIIAAMTPTGAITFWLNTADTPKPVRIATGPLRLHDGNWHDITLHYDAATGQMDILVDGTPQGRGRAKGPLRRAESWGLTLGNPHGKKSFDGTLASLDLRVNTASMAR